MKRSNKENYHSPETDIVDICAGTMFCASGNTQNYGYNDFSDGWSEEK